MATRQLLSKGGGKLGLIAGILACVAQGLHNAQP